MAAYLVANIEITDAHVFQEYRDKVPAVIAAHGGRYLVRGGAVERLEGDAAVHRVVVLEFPDLAKLKAFYDSPQYRQLIALRKKGSRAQLFAVEGVA